MISFCTCGAQAKELHDECMKKLLVDGKKHDFEATIVETNPLKVCVTKIDGMPVKPFPIAVDTSRMKVPYG